MSFHHSVLILTESFWLILSFWTHLQAIPTHSELKCRFCPNVLKISHSRPSPFRNGLIMRIISFRCHSSCCHWNDRAGLRMTGLTIEWQDGEGPGEAIPVQSPIIPASARHLGLIRKPLNHCGWGWNDKKFESEVLWFPWQGKLPSFGSGLFHLLFLFEKHGHFKRKVEKGKKKSHVLAEAEHPQFS